MDTFPVTLLYRKTLKHTHTHTYAHKYTHIISVPLLIDSIFLCLVLATYHLIHLHLPSVPIAIYVICLHVHVAEQEK